MLQDLRYSLRVLLKRPIFTLTVGITLALGIGVNIAMFSVLDAILLRNLPFEKQDQLVTLWSTNPQKGINQLQVSEADFADWQTSNTVFEQMALYDSDSQVLTGNGDPERVQGAKVSANLFSLLGVQPILGRAFLPEEGKPGGEHVVILSNGLWHRRFNSDASVIGKAVTLDNDSYIIIGVLPPAFRFIEKADIWSPLTPGANSAQERDARHFTAIARLKSDSDLKKAQAEMEMVARRLQQQYSSTNANWGINLIPLKEYLVAGVRSSLLTLFGAVAFVLLIAFINVTSLLLTRMAARRQELAVRVALGSSFMRLMGQAFTESAVLTVFGSILGLILAFWIISIIAALIPETIPHGEITIDGRVLAFTVLISLLLSLAFGAIQALLSSKLNLNELLKDSPRSVGEGVRRTKGLRLLMIFEIALSLVLLIGAGLMIRSFWSLQRVNPGFNPNQVLTAKVMLPTSSYPKGPQQVAFFQQLLQQLQAVPGVQSVGGVTSLPLSGSSMNFRFKVEEQPSTSSEAPRQAQYMAITPNYFHTMGIPLLKGRDLTDRDGTDAPGVVILNETMARRLFPNGDALGKHLTISYGKPMSREIVGIVGDVKHLKLEESAKPAMYVPYLQNPWPFMSIVVRTSGTPSNIGAVLRKEVWNIDKNQPVDDLMSMEQVLSESMAQPRLYTLLLSIFAVLATLLAAVGIYGVISYGVSLRTHEMGIRLALGAQEGDILRLIMKRGIIDTLVGLALGVALALALTRLLSSLLYGVGPTDPLTFIEVVLLLCAVALLACYLPARRATKVDPLVALRYE